MSVVERSTSNVQRAAPPDAQAERLRRVARDLESVFVEQMFKAMRETVPEGGVVDGGSGEEMFTGMLDQRMAALAPARWEHGLSEVLYRQLRGSLKDAAPATPGVDAPPAVPGAAIAASHSSPAPGAPILTPCAPPRPEST